VIAYIFGKRNTFSAFFHCAARNLNHILFPVCLTQLPKKTVALYRTEENNFSPNLISIRSFATELWRFTTNRPTLC